VGLYFRRGQANITFCTAIASTTLVPTAAEITAGVDLSKAILGVTGFNTTLNRVNTALLDYAQEVQVAGPQTFGDASLTIADDDGVASADSTARVAARTALAEGTNGYIVIAASKRGKPTSSTKVDVWPVLVGALNREITLDAQVARSTAQLAITGAAAKDVAVT
jgi:hypothetical protein